MHLATINGKAVSDVALVHRMWAELLDITERFETRRPVASPSTRLRLELLSSEMEAGLRETWSQRGEQPQMVGIVLNRFVRLEEELGAMVADLPQHESFDGLVTWDGWAHERLSGEDDELQASADEAAAEATAYRFELHRLRKTTANRVQLAKLGMVPRFSWAEAWKQTKQQMRELGAEARKCDAWVKQVERELRIRRAERAELEKPVTRWMTSDMEGVIECETDFQLPSEYDECRRLREEEGR